MSREFISKSIWIIAGIALICAMLAVSDIDAGAQDNPTPTPTEEYYTCWWEVDHWVCLSADPPSVTPTPAATPLPAPTVAPTPTQVELQPISRCVVVNCVYVPFVAAGEVVTGDTR